LDKSIYNAWSDAVKIAFRFNSYNALTLKVIIDNYLIKPTFPARLYHPRNSIRQIPGVWDKISHPVMVQDLTLDDIEHKILRVEFNEPRIHMAIVCASIGCALLRNEPYYDYSLKDQFYGQTFRFLQDHDKFAIDRYQSTVHLSPYFKWFGEDFIKTYGTEIRFTKHNKAERASLNFISAYLNEGDKTYLLKAQYKINYLGYDWSLNEQK